MVDVAASVSKVAHGPFLLADLEPATSGSAPAWAGVQKSGWHGLKETARALHAAHRGCAARQKQ